MTQLNQNMTLFITNMPTGEEQDRALEQRRQSSCGNASRPRAFKRDITLLHSL
jgi:hypothetical protein